MAKADLNNRHVRGGGIRRVLIFLGSRMRGNDDRVVIQSFPKHAGNDAGFQLSAGQEGLSPTNIESQDRCLRCQVYSSNVLIDPGFAPEEIAILAMRARLVVDPRQCIESKHPTQHEAAAKLGLAQSRAYDPVRGKGGKFRLEMLITLEGRLGRKVSLKLAA